MDNRKTLVGISLGKRLKDARKQAGYTQQQAAETFTISTGTYKNWEQGRALMNAAQIIDAAALFGVSVSFLLASNSNSDLNNNETAIITAYRLCDKPHKTALLIAAKDAANACSTGGGGGNPTNKMSSLFKLLKLRKLLKSNKRRAGSSPPSKERRIAKMQPPM